MIIELIILTCIFLYIFIFTSIVHKSFPDDFNILNAKENSDSKLLQFSIIVAAKNEGTNISNLVSALKNLNYPQDNYEVIIVDDKSNDDTLHLAKKLTIGLDNFTVVTAINKKYEGKRGTLDYGISIAKYPTIAITDADCVPDANWLLCLTPNFNMGCDFVFGIAPFYQSSKLVNKISCYENLRNSILAFSAVNNSLPYTASARNFSFKKDAFKNIGGYKNTIETISGDDDLLLREAVKNGLKVCSLTAPGSYVYSESKKTFKEYFSQRARHTQSSFHYPLKLKLFLAAWHLINLAFVFSPAFMFLNKILILPFLIKILFDIVTSVTYQKKIGYKFTIFEVVYLQLLYEIFLIVHLIKAKFGKIEWK